METIKSWFTPTDYFLGIMFILAIIAVVAVLVAVLYGIYKAHKHPKETKEITEYSIKKDLISKGLVDNVKKEDIQHAKKKMKKAKRDRYITKEVDGLEKKFSKKYR